MPQLTERQHSILKVVVAEHVSTAQPVSSEAVARKLSLGLSAATIRNEMAELEELGYLSHPHTSAGRQPTEKGYRYFVEWLLEEHELAADARLSLRRRFRPDNDALENWIARAAQGLAVAARNTAVVSAPRAPESRLKHLELVCVNERLVLMVVVLTDSSLRQHFLSFAESTTQADVTRIANHLNHRFSGCSANQMDVGDESLGGVEPQVSEALVRLMRQVDQHQYSELRVEGISYILAQPEFERSAKLRRVLELLSEPRALGELLVESAIDDRPRIIIGGDDNAAFPLRDCSLVLGRYGGGGEVSGVLAVVGPMRMEYDRAISSVRYLASLLNEVLAELYDWK
ncbi:MAG: heat-inducible transcriptional repressor HrcA [Chloroflexota bacterium]